MFIREEPPQYEFSPAWLEHAFDIWWVADCDVKLALLGA